MKTQKEQGYFTQFSNTATGTTGHWVKLTKTVTVPANIKKLNIRIDNNGGGTVWFDDVEIKRAGFTEIVQEDNYYAFGMKHSGYNDYLNGGNALAQKYKYNGKELQDEFRLNLYDYGARNYDPAIGRWFNIDPLAEKSRRFSPYTYALDNPVFFIDPDGMQADWVRGKDGKAVTYTKNSDGSITWSANATNDIKKVGNSMLLTSYGEKQFNKWQDASTEVNIKIDYKTSADDAPGFATTAAKTIFGKPQMNEDGQYEKVTVTFYDNLIQEAMTDSDPRNRFNGATEDEVYGANGSHEPDHNDSEQIKLDNETPREQDQDPKKNKPYNSEVNYRREYHQLYPNQGNPNWEDLYKTRGYEGN